MKKPATPKITREELEAIAQRQGEFLKYLETHPVPLMLYLSRLASDVAKIAQELARRSRS